MRKPVGRFAPSPTGDLHFGSLVAALGSYLNVRSQGGEWLVRIENIDPPREVSGAGQRQIEALERHGLFSDRDVAWQLDSTRQHRAALAQLIEAGRAFPCSCTRSDLPPDGVYPGTCRDGIPKERQARSVRLRVADTVIGFNDGIQGAREQNLATECGDFVIGRADGLIAYQLAVVVDDALAGVSEVVRGMDLIDSTARQIAVYRALGLEPPRYAHLPLITDSKGRKLSKSEQDDPVRVQSPVSNLKIALHSLGHTAPSQISKTQDLLEWAIASWDLSRVPQGPSPMSMAGEST
ncbi:MAG: tRNA glutamyl-Q(34) synthetase GluQRS [Pseudomonadota bacterium]